MGIKHLSLERLVVFILGICCSLILMNNFNVRMEEPLEAIRATYNQDDSKLKLLSEILTEKSKKLGQLSCEKNRGQISISGGWCEKISGGNSTKHRTDPFLVTYLSKFLKGKIVASFGDGPGLYKKGITELGEVASYDAFDGAPFTETTTDHRCQFLDLSVPIYHLEDKYDWVISMEVAEHIPKEYEQIYLDNLARYAKEGIILSWGKIGQGGHGHVNNQPLTYVLDQMAARGFKRDEDLSDEIKKHTRYSWFKNNLNVYYRV